MADDSMKRYERERIRYYDCCVCIYALNAERLEMAFFVQIGELVGTPDLLERWVDASRLGTAESRDLRRAAKKLEAELAPGLLQTTRDRLFDLALSAGITDAEFRWQIDRLNADLVEKRARLASLAGKLSGHDVAGRTLTDARALLKDFRHLYEGAEYERKRQLVETLVEALGGAVTSRDGIRWLRRPAVKVHRPKRTRS